MDAVTTALSGAIGARVKQERLARRWTLDQLADAADVSRRMLVNVEQGIANPSVGILLRIGDALGVGLPALVEPPQRPVVQVTAAGGGSTLWTGAAGGRGVLVSGTRSPDVVELWEWTLEPGDRHASDAHSDGTKELLQVVEGVLELTVGDESFVLSPGDAVSFPGDVPHSYATAPGGDTAVRFSLAVFEPGVGAHPRSPRDRSPALARSGDGDDR